MVLRFLWSNWPLSGQFHCVHRELPGGRSQPVGHETGEYEENKRGETKHVPDVVIDLNAAAGRRSLLNLHIDGFSQHASLSKHSQCEPLNLLRRSIFVTMDRFSWAPPPTCGCHGAHELQVTERGQNPMFLRWNVSLVLQVLVGTFSLESADCHTC